MEHDDDEQQQQQQQVSMGSASYEKLPPLCSKYPWFIVQKLEDEEEGMGIDTEFLSTLHEEERLIKYECEIPVFNGRRIRGCFHGWFVLSEHRDNVMWYLWNPVSLKIVRLPPLILKDDGDGESIDECLLTAPPGDPTSVLLLTRRDASTFVFCRLLNCKRKSRLRWTEMSYAKQLQRLTYDGEILHSLTCCSNGKIYALNSDGFICPIIIQVEIEIVNEKQVMIQLVLFGASCANECCIWECFIRGYGTQLFCISVCYHDKTKKKIGDVCLFRLDTASIQSEELERLKKWDISGMIVEQIEFEDLKDLEITRVMWEEITDLKDGVFYVDLGRDRSIFYNPRVIGGGGYVHVRDGMDEILHLYNVRDRTIISSSMHPRVVSTTHVSMWEGDHVEAPKCTSTVKQDERVVVVVVDERNESRLHNIPFDVLETLMERCVGVDYLNFRATCKLCRVAAPPIQWSNGSSLRRLHNYSLNSPWLMVVDKHGGIVSFTDPLSGDNYFMMKSRESLISSIVDDQMYCSGYGWLLFKSREFEFECPVFFNPFTTDVCKLPEFRSIRSLCFSAPPNSSDCIVAGFGYDEGEWHFIHSSVGASSWRFLPLGLDDHLDCKHSLTFIGRDLYAMFEDGQVFVFKNLGKQEVVRKTVLGKAPMITSRCCDSQYYLMSCDDQHLLLVIVGDQFGQVEVFKQNNDWDWEKIDGIGKHTIYVGGATSVCVHAKTSETENKIYFTQQFWYSLETHTYHTSSDGEKIIKTCFLGPKSHFNAHAWVQPSWAS